MGWGEGGQQVTELYLEGSKCCLLWDSRVIVNSNALFILKWLEEDF